jgi:pyruvate/2-oxoglutarate dehydrogenase complex dihydrolipoamide acyltransferase (E2) component
MIVPPRANIYLRPNVETVQAKQHRKFHGDDNVLILETGKVAIDIPSPAAGRVVAIHVTAGDTVAEGALLASLETT